MIELKNIHSFGCLVLLNIQQNFFLQTLKYFSVALLCSYYVCILSGVVMYIKLCEGILNCDTF